MDSRNSKNLFSSIFDAVNNASKNEQFTEDFKKLYNNFLKFDNRIQDTVNKENLNKVTDEFIDRVTETADKIATAIVDKLQDLDTDLEITPDEAGCKCDSNCDCHKYDKSNTFASKIAQKVYTHTYDNPLYTVTQHLYDELNAWYNDTDTDNKIFDIHCKVLDAETVVITAYLEKAELVSVIKNMLDEDHLKTKLYEACENIFVNEHMGFKFINIKPVEIANSPLIEFKLFN